MDSTSWPQELGSRGFIHYLSARTVSAFGSAFGLIAITFAVLQGGLGTFGLGVVLASNAAGSAIFMLFGGAIGDRFPKIAVLAAMDIVMGLSQLGCVVLIVSGHAGLTEVALSQFIRGAAYAVFAPTSTALLPSLLPQNRLQRGNTSVLVFENLAGVVAPAAAGILVATTSPSVALAVDAVSYFFSAAIIIFTPMPQLPSSIARTSPILREIRAGWREFASRPWVWQLVISFGIYQATVLPAILILGPQVLSQEDGGATEWAIVLSARALGSLVAGPILYFWNPARPLVAVSLALIVDIPFLLSIGISAPLWVVCVLGMASAAALTSSDAIWFTQLQSSIPEDAIARVSSYDWLGSLVMNPLGAVLIGSAAEVSSAFVVLMTIVLIHFVTRVLLLISPAIRFPPGASAAA